LPAFQASLPRGETSILCLIKLRHNLPDSLVLLPHSAAKQWHHSADGVILMFKTVGTAQLEKLCRHHQKIKLIARDTKSPQNFPFLFANIETSFHNCGIQNRDVNG
jgi:hypothetical protein